MRKNLIASVVFGVIGGLVGPAMAHPVPGATLTAKEQALVQRSQLRDLADPGDLRPQAREILARLSQGGWQAAHHAAAHKSGWFGFSHLPPFVRVWRRSLGSSTSCSGQVDLIPLEEYVKGVLPHEWIPSWHDESLKAGAVAIRTYATAWVARGGKYDCADLCDTTYSQVYEEETLPQTNAAVEATRGRILVLEGEPVFAEYSAENGHPTKTGVSDPVCAGKELYGHGRGMCQWGTQRWATQENKSYDWIALHYYPGSQWWVAPQPSDSGPSLPPDSGPSMTPDAWVPGSDPVSPDAGVSWDSGPLPVTVGPTDDLSGGCSVVAVDAGPGCLAAALVLLLLVSWRRRR